MAIHSIEYTQGVPMETYYQRQLDVEPLFRKGLLIAKTLGVGRKPNILPKSCAHVIRRMTIPIVVHEDGTATLALRKELVEGSPYELDPIMVTETDESLRLEMRGLIPDENHGVYYIFGMPETTRSVPFLINPDISRGNAMTCYGMLWHRPGPSPKADRIYSTAAGMERALGL